MITGVKIKELKKITDGRGFLSEIMRDDWGIVKEKIAQANISKSAPGVIRAWHRHERGQIDYMIVLEGSVKICVYNEKTKELAEIINKPGVMHMVRIPGKYWHGYKVIGNKPAVMLYFLNKLYDYKNPDELRMDPNEPKVVPKRINGKTNDTRVNKPWVW